MQSSISQEEDLNISEVMDWVEEVQQGNEREKNDHHLCWRLDQIRFDLHKQSKSITDGLYKIERLIMLICGIMAYIAYRLS